MSLPVTSKEASHACRHACIVRPGLLKCEMQLVSLFQRGMSKPSLLEQASDPAGSLSGSWLSPRLSHLRVASLHRDSKQTSMICCFCTIFTPCYFPLFVSFFLGRPFLFGHGTFQEIVDRWAASLQGLCVLLRPSHMSRYRDAQLIQVLPVECRWECKWQVKRFLYRRGNGVRCRMAPWSNSVARREPQCDAVTLLRLRARCHAANLVPVILQIMWTPCGSMHVLARFAKIEASTLARHPRRDAMASADDDISRAHALCPADILQARQMT